MGMFGRLFRALVMSVGACVFVGKRERSKFMVYRPNVGGSARAQHGHIRIYNK